MTRLNRPEGFGIRRLRQTRTWHARVHVTQVHRLLHSQEDTVCGDSGYIGAEKREELQRVWARA